MGSKEPLRNPLGFSMSVFNVFHYRVEGFEFKSQSLKPWVYFVTLDRSVSQWSKYKCNAKGPGNVEENSSTKRIEMSATDDV